MYYAENLSIDSNTSLILAKEKVVFGKVHSITTESGQELLSKNLPEQQDNTLSASTYLAAPHYQGVRYNHTTGNITGYVVSEQGNTRSKSLESIKIREEYNTKELELIQALHLPPKEKTLHIESCATMTVHQFEENYRHFSHAHPREGQDPGKVLVRPCVVQMVRQLDKKRLGLGNDPNNPDQHKR